MSNKVRNIFFVLGVVALIAMIMTMDMDLATIWANIRRSGYIFIVIMLLWGVLYILNTISWRIIIRGSGDCPTSFWRLYKITITGFALNNCTPVGLLGGEPYKIMEMKNTLGVHRATSSVLLFAMMYVFGHFMYWASAVILYMAFYLSGFLRMGTPMAIVLTLTAILCSGGLYFFSIGYRQGISVRLIQWASKVPGFRGWGKRFLDAHREDLENVDRQIAELHSQSSKAFYSSMALEYIGRILMSVEIGLLLYIAGAKDPLWLLMIWGFIILAFTSLFSNMLFIIPGQVGGREGGFAMTAAQVGLSGGAGLFVAIMCRIREILWTVVGIMLMKVGNKSKK